MRPVRPAFLVLLSGCAAGGEGPAGSTPPPPPDDLWAEAFGGCTSVAETIDAEVGAWSTTVTEHDARGDLLSMARTPADPETAEDSWTYTYGAVHEWTRIVHEVGGAPADGETVAYTWEGGHMVLEETDYGSDGTVDETGAYVYDEQDHLVRWEFDLDADGTPDDSADWTWTAEGEGWRVVAEGVDPNGPYTIEEEYDAELHALSQVYEDSTGLGVVWEVEEYSALDLVGTWEMRWSIDGVEVLIERWDRAFDELGREVSEVATDEDVSEDQIFGSFERTTTTEYTCP